MNRRWFTERRRTFNHEFKLGIERGVAVAQAAKDLDVRESVLRKCVRELREAPQEACVGNGNAASMRIRRRCCAGASPRALTFLACVSKRFKPWPGP